MNRTLSKYLCFFPPRILRGENTHKYVKEVSAVQELSEKEIQVLQLKKLKSLMSKHSKIPYFRDMLRENNLVLDNWSSLRELETLPVLEKSYMRSNLHEFKHDDIHYHFERKTSGSTGMPFVFYKDRYSTAYMDAIMYSGYEWHGIGIGERQARFWGMPFSRKKSREARLKDILMNRIRLSAFEMEEEQLAAFYDKIRKFRPVYIYGYPSLIYEFVRFCSNSRLRLEDLKLKALIVTGEKIVESQREYIASAFNTNIVQEYGCTEVGVIAFECRMGNMHVMSPNIIMEVIQNGNTVVDSVGEIIVTELNAMSYPFIRYKLGDRGAVLSEKCSCGINYPLVDIREGRRDDYIVTPDGKRIYDAILAYTFGEFQDSVKQFKAIQRSKDLLEIDVLSNGSFDSIIEEACENKLRKALGFELKIVFKQVEEIRRDASGKLRYFESAI